MTYRIRWVEVSHHEVELTAEEVARMLSCDVSELGGAERSEEPWSNLADDLANLDEDGFQWLCREDIKVEEI